MRHTPRAVSAFRAVLLAVPVTLALAAPSGAHAQVDVNVRLNLGLPVRPPLVVVQPGVQVVEDFDDEVFFVEGAYWARRGDRWYWSRTPGAAFVVVEPRRVPAAIVRIPPGQYKKWRKKHPEAAARLEGRGHDDHPGHGHDRGRGDDHGKHDHGKHEGKGHGKR